MSIARGIREYLARDWHLARNRKDQHWAARLQILGPGEALRVSDELRRQALALRPGWPTDEERRQDLAGHARLTMLLRRADHTRGR